MRVEIQRASRRETRRTGCRWRVVEYGDVVVDAPPFNRESIEQRVLIREVTGARLAAKLMDMGWTIENYAPDVRVQTLGFSGTWVEADIFEPEWDGPPSCNGVSCGGCQECDEHDEADPDDFDGSDYAVENWL